MMCKPLGEILQDLPASLMFRSDLTIGLDAIALPTYTYRYQIMSCQRSMNKC